ncbi:uncharacterized protein LOC114769619 [Denticeps clupeoides]|uniref:uncharacterized protein LOC114769619 n=1 Tax=Denticeps clupeoides TaxID=299321 RepID=UPI0010A3542C|nr:uncharacterized protein LOC114769619 [Denticeps clupeoides]
MEMPDLNCTYKPPPVQCNGFDPRAFRWALTMRLAVEEINSNNSLLPNHTLGYKIFDSCAYPLTGQRAALAVINGAEEHRSPMCAGAAPLLAIIGESGSAQSIVVSRILQPLRIPMISYFSSCACLGDRTKFPTFFRVIPSDDYQVKAIAHLLQHFNWTWVGVVRGDHEYGRFALQGLLRELSGTRVCIAYQLMIPLLYNRQKAQEIIDIMRTSTAKVVVVFSAEGELTPFLRDYMEQNVTGIQWIASEAWVTSAVFAGSQYYPYLGGTIGFGIRKGYIPGLRDYLMTVLPQRYPSNPLVHELWGALYGCFSSSSTGSTSQLPPCTGHETLRQQHAAYMNTSSPRISYNVYKAVYAIAYSLHNLIQCEAGKGPFPNSSCADINNVYPWQLQHYLQDVSFNILGEEVNFDDKGDSIPSYDLINWQRGSEGNIEFINVGMFDGSNEAGKELIIQDGTITWAGHQSKASCSHCVYQYMRCPLMKICRVKWRCWCLCAVTAALRDTGKLSVLGSLCAVLTVYHVTVGKLVMRQGASRLPEFYKDGDFVIGGVFSIHYYMHAVEHNYTSLPESLKCTGSMDTRELRFARAMEFAVEQINNRSDLLPDIVLGYQIHDSCAAVPVALKVAFQFANGQDAEITTSTSCANVASVAAIVGESGSTPSIGMSRVLSLFGIPQVSHSATCACLSDKRQYPAFFRTTPSDHFQSAALARLVRHFGWTWIGAVRSDSDYGNNGMASFLRAAQSEGICAEYSVAFYRTNPRSKVERVADVIRGSTSRVIVAFLATGDMRILLEELARRPPPPLQWIGSESWVADPEMLRFGLVAGAVGFGIEQSVIPGLRPFLLDLSPARVALSPLLSEFWEGAFDCKLTQVQSKGDTSGKHSGKMCTGTEDLSAVNIPYTDTSQLRVTNMVYKATYAIAHALHRVVCDSVSNCDKNVIVEPHQVLQHLKKVNFTVNGYPVTFDANGDPVARYELINWQVSEDGTIKFVTVGRYDASKPKGHEFSLNRNITWMNRQTQCVVTAVPQALGRHHRKEGLSAAMTVYHVEKGRSVMKQEMGITYPLILNAALWVLGFTPVMSLSSLTSCTLQGISSPIALYKDGDIIIGGIFSLHHNTLIMEQNYTNIPEPIQCTGGMYTRELRFARALEFAVQEINKRSDLLPSVVLGYEIHDSCGAVPVALKAALQFANGEDRVISMGTSCSKVASVAAIVGDSNSTPSVGMSRVLSLFGIPQVSHFATCACLSDKRQHPAFFRTVPSDYFQAAALAQLVKHFGWTWIGAIRSDSDYGNSGMASFLSAAQKEGICIEYSLAIYRTYPRKKVERIAEVIRSSTSRVIVAFLALGEMHALLEELLLQPPPRLQWIGSESWVTDPDMLKFELFAGAVGFSIERSVIPGFREFLLNLPAAEVSQFPLLTEFWEDTFGCKIPRKQTNSETTQGVKLCTGTEDLSVVNIPYTDTSQLRITNMVYKATYAIAHAIHSIVCKDLSNSFIMCNKTIAVEPHQILTQLKKVNFTVNGYPVTFDTNGDPVARYELINWQRDEAGTMNFVTVGLYDASKPKGQELSLTRNITWLNGQTQVPVSVCSDSCPPGTRKAAQKGRPVCCYDCVPCGEGEISNETDSLDCVPCPDEYWPNEQRDKCLPKPIEYLSWDEVLGIILAACSIAGAIMAVIVTVIFYQQRSSPIVRANNSELSFLLLFSLTLCFLCSLTFIGRPSQLSCILRHIAFGITFVLCISCVLGKTLVVLMAFRATLPGSNIMKWFGPPQQRLTVVCFTFVQALICTLWLVLSPPFPIKNMSYYKERIILECSLGSVSAFWAVLGYIGLLAVLCFVLAFLARKLPDNFNEAKFITFSMLIFCAVWITFIPAYVSSPGKFTVAVEIFAILASSFGLIACIFAPKCFIILFRPEQNTKKHLMGKVASKAL